MIAKNRERGCVLLVSSRCETYQAFGKECERFGIELQTCSRIAEALQYLSMNIPVAVLVDLFGFELVGLEFCHNVKSTVALKGLPLLVIGSGDSEEAEIAAFDAGADDFVRFPASAASLFRRLQVRLRLDKRSISFQSHMNGYDQVKIDRDSYSVYINNEQIQLSNKEFELLYLMASQPGKVFTREEIFNKVWNREAQQKDRSIDVHILRLRRKLGRNLISTQKGIGYRFRAIN